MKRSTLQPIIVLSAVYLAILIAGQSLLPAAFNAPLYFLLGPLLLAVVLLIKDLSRKAAVPTENRGGKRIGRRIGWKVQTLTNQIRIAEKASLQYYDAVLVSRLREILVEKVTLETGIERERIAETLKNGALGPGLLRDGELYMLLYCATPDRGAARVRGLERAVELIEAWKA